MEFRSVNSSISGTLGDLFKKIERLSGASTIYTISGNFAGTGTSATNASITLNTAGLAISVNPGGGTGVGTYVSTLTSTGNNINLTLNTSGITMAYPQFSTISGGTGGTSAILNLDGGFPDTNYMGVSLIDAGGVL